MVKLSKHVKRVIWVVCEQRCHTSKRDGLCWDCCCAMIGGHMKGIKASLLCLMRGGHLGVMNFQRWLLCDG
jgi:hypothetical protein